VRDAVNVCPSAGGISKEKGVNMIRPAGDDQKGRNQAKMKTTCCYEVIEKVNQLTFLRPGPLKNEE
jgi:hypothetical protein